MAAVLHHSRAKGTAKLVLLGIANHDGDGGAYPAVSTLARYANTHERTVQRAIDQLVARGELRRELQAGGSREMPDHDRPNRYHVLVSCPPWCDRTSQHRDTRERRQPGLWTKGVASTPPGGASAPPPPAPVPPPRVASTPPEPPTQPDPPSLGTAPQGAEWCRECGRPGRARCELAQAKVRHEDRHSYQPHRRGMP